MKNHSLPLILLLLLVGGSLAGCGADDDNFVSLPHNNPPLSNLPPTGDPPADDPPAEEPPADQPPAQEPPVEEPPEEPPAEDPVPEEPVGALTLDPEIAAKGVAPNGAIVLLADRPLDTTTVETSVELRNAETTETVAANASYDADQQRIVISPAGTFAEGMQYAVHVDGARDTEGNVIAISGQSVLRVKQKQRIYSRTTLYDDDGITPYHVSHYSRVPGSNEALRVRYNGPGPDGVWHEGKDNVSGYERTKIFSDGTEEVFTYNGPGDDDVWFEGSDDFERAWRYRYMPDGRIMERLQTESAGVDGDFFTADDHYRVAEFRVYNMLGQQTLSVYRSEVYPEEMRLNPGPDEEWLTGDDGVFVYERYEYGADGRLSRKLAYSTSAGGPNDGIAFSDDDRLLDYTTYLYDKHGLVSETHSYYGPGTDNTWLNDNDEAGSFYRFIRTNSVIIKEFWDAGADDRVNTGDEWLRDYHLREYDAQGRLSRTGTYEWEGKDGDWHTPDDEPFSWADIYQYDTDELGRPQMKVISLKDNGPDGDRFSGDEEITAKWVRVHDETSQVTYQRIYFEPGVLAGWEDGDEVLYGDTEFIDIDE